MNTERATESSSNNSSSRKCTDIPAMIVLGGFLAFIIVFSIVSSDMSILTKDRDDCGNICGELNLGNPYDQCGPHDKTNQSKVLAVRQENMTWVIHFSCINKCPDNHTEVANHCWKIGEVRKPPMTYFNLIKDISEMLMTNWWEVFVFCPFCFIFFEVMIILMKFVPKTTLWVSHISFILVASILAFFFLGFSYYIPWWADLSILVFWFVIFEVIMVIWFGKRMKILAKMLSETTRTMLVIPWITLVPIVTFLILTILISAFLFTSLMIETSGTFSPGTSEADQFQLQYQDTIIMKLAQFLNILTFLWLANFIVNCQHFIVAGSVTKWYFTRDKSGMAGISKSSVFNLVRFHLGSVSFGSIVVPVMRLAHFGLRVFKLIKGIIEKYFKNLKSEKVNKYFDSIERFLGSFTKQSYVGVERTGTPFFQSGSRAFDLVLKNFGDIHGLSFFKDLTLLICQMLVILFSLIVGFIIVDIPSLVHMLVAPIAVALIFTFTASYCFFAAYSMIIETLLLCFCIDCEENDGDLNPYFMINSVKKIVVEIKKQILEDSNKNRTEAANNTGTNMNQMYEAF